MSVTHEITNHIPFPQPHHAPGIHFGVSDRAYHDDPSLSASGIKNLGTSPLDYWMRSALNPNRVEKDSEALAEGRAWHKRLLEGSVAFSQRYIVKPSEDEYPNAVKGADAIKALAVSMNIKPGKNMLETSRLIREQDAVVELWPLILEEFESQREGREVLTRKVWREIELGMLVIDRLDSVRNAFKGGHGEVSLFWRNNLGIPMKARIDYLKLKALVDLKTMANQQERPIEQAVGVEIASRKYFISPPIYIEGLTAVKKLYAEKGDAVVFGDIDRGWVKKVLQQPHHAFIFVFAAKGDVPNAIAREFAQFEDFGGQGASANGYWLAGERAYEDGCERYIEGLRTFGTDTPWVADYGLRALRDTEMPPWMQQPSHGVA
jgi:hypothetical protein